MAEPTTQYHLGDILSFTTGFLVAPTGMTGVQALAEYLLGHPVFTHQLVWAADICGMALLDQHPQLAAVDLAGTDPANHAARLAEQVARFGEYLPVRPMSPAPRPRDPIGDLHESAPDAEIVVIEVQR